MGRRLSTGPRTIIQSEQDLAIIVAKVIMNWLRYESRDGKRYVSAHRLSEQTGIPRSNIGPAIRLLVAAEILKLRADSTYAVVDEIFPSDDEVRARLPALRIDPSAIVVD
jgi:hypothetical protein